MVLIGAYASYRQLSSNLEDQIGSLSIDDSVFLVEHGPSVVKRSRLLEMGLILFGTAIWGYGDFLIS